MVSRLKENVEAWRRVLRLARKPDGEEFKLLLRLSLIGFAIVGGIAYVVHLLATLVFPSLAP
ncbi:MAG: protein translocase SEC61 complex subunit gamma [Fervidicoccaceae archaeon]